MAKSFSAVVRVVLVAQCPAFYFVFLFSGTRGFFIGFLAAVSAGGLDKRKDSVLSSGPSVTGLHSG